MYRKETYRVLSLDVYKTEDAFYVNITFADNATSTTELSELRQESKWKVKRQTQRQVDLLPCWNFLHNDW